MIQSGAHSSSAATEIVDPLIGRVLNERFRIIEALGSGGMGRVYKAVQAPLDRPVAVKVLNPHYSDGKDPGFQKRFFLEASVTSKLRHPNTVTVIDYGKTEDGILYLVMEYLEGKTLAQLLTQNGPMSWVRALHVGQQVARSLREAHKVGLIHRDLKPANVMVMDQEADHDVVKVLDFGLVKSFVDGGVIPNETEITQAGVILGSPQYMAPEQARNISDPRSDVYSLGVVLYQMLVGRPPFQAPQSIDVIFKHLNEAPPIFSAVWPHHQVPQEVEALVMKCLCKRPDERYQSMDEVLDAMRRVAASAGVSGVFSPRTFSTGAYQAIHPGSGPHSGPQSGPQTGPILPHSGASTMALDIAVVEPVPQARPARSMLALALFAASLLVGLGVAAVLALRAQDAEPPTPTALTAPAVKSQPEEAPPAPVAPAAAPAAQPVAETIPEFPSPEEVPTTVAPVRFLITSEPSGARVTYEGRELGETPVELEVPASSDGVASAQLTFSLEGYQRATVVAQGNEASVRFTQRLKKKSVSRTSESEKSGYKEDPY
jgi:serine/threonine-protein kinase